MPDFTFVLYGMARRDNDSEDCRLHLMLRALAWLLSPKRLSTPHSGEGDLSPYLGPATRRSDAYRDATSTR